MAIRFQSGSSAVSPSTEGVAAVPPSWASASSNMSPTGSAKVLAATLRTSTAVLADHFAGRASVDRSDWKLDNWAHQMLRASGTEVTVRGELPLTAGGPYIYMSNHPGTFDIVAMYAALPGPLRMVAMAPLFDIPILGAALRAEGYVGVTRTGSRDAAKAQMGQVGANMKRGISYWMAPEGGLSPAGGGLRPTFKKGGFILAHDLGAKIVPVTIRGTEKIHPDGALQIRHGQPVEVTVGQPIAMAERTVDEGMQAVRAALEQQFATASRMPVLFTVGRKG